MPVCNAPCLGVGLQMERECSLTPSNRHPSKRGGDFGPWLWCLPLLVLLTGCLPGKKLTVGVAAMLVEDVAKSSYRQSDLRLIREGMPSYLLLMDGMVEGWPDNERLLIAAAQGYSSFASAFVEDQDKDYAKVLYGRAKGYALRALAIKGLQDPLQPSLDDFQQGLKAFGKEDTSYLFWAAACWGSWIGLSLDSMEALADLPKVELMMRRALELDETFYYGGPHLFMGIWYASRPKIAGGDPEKARAHFLRAMELGQGRFLMAGVYFADHYAKRVLDRDLFMSTLRDVLATPADVVPDLTLLNTVAHKRATELLRRVDEYFE
jgi:hypothetical protein